MPKRVCAALMLWCLPTLAGAQQSHLTLNQNAQDAGIDGQALEDRLNGQIQEALKLGTPDVHQQFINSMVEAAAISAKGMGVDYASNMKTFVAGGSISSGVHEAGFSFKRGGDLLPKGGYGAQISLMAGLNLGLGGDKESQNALDRFRLYVNGMAMQLPNDRQFGGQMANAGGHLQVKLIGGNQGDIVEWGGLDLTSGFEYAAYSFNLRQSLPIDAPLGGDGTVTWKADGTYNINSDVMSVPVELSTNLRVFVVTAYLGGAYDYNMGTGTSRADLGGPLDGRVLAPDGSTFQGNLGTATVTAAADGVSDANAYRVFAGTQLNIFAFKAWGHLNVAFNGAVGGHIGGRVAI